jgi:hypothetical protein
MSLHVLPYSEEKSVSIEIQSAAIDHLTQCKNDGGVNNGF